MPAIAQLGRSVIDQIVARFPRTPRHRIRGSGKFLLVFKCRAIWSINAYQTAEERDATWEKYQWSACGALNCVHDHVKVDL